MDLDVSLLKFFPAEAACGLDTLSALASPFPAVRFMATGGIDAERARRYLPHPAVVAVGGSWMVPAEHVAAADWSHVERLVREIVAWPRTFEEAL